MSSLDRRSRARVRPRRRRKRGRSTRGDLGSVRAHIGAPRSRPRVGRCASSAAPHAWSRAGVGAHACGRTPRLHREAAPRRVGRRGYENRRPGRRNCVPSRRRGGSRGHENARADALRALGPGRNAPAWGGGWTSTAPGPPRAALARRRRVARSRSRGGLYTWDTRARPRRSLGQWLTMGRLTRSSRPECSPRISTRGGRSAHSPRSCAGRCHSVPRPMQGPAERETSPKAPFQGL